MATENKLNDKLLESLVGKWQDKQETIADGRGSLVRVSTIRGISSVFYYRLGGRESPSVWLTFGRYPDMSLAMAKRICDQCREWLVENLDPRRQIKLVAEKTMQPVIVRDALLYWYDNHATAARREHEYLIKRSEKHIFPYIGDIAIEQCKSHTWLIIFDRIKKNAPVMSGTIFPDIKQALCLCCVRQYIACDPFGDIDVSYVGRSLGMRDRVFNINETADVWSYAYGNNLLTLSSIYDRRTMVICLVFGCRQQEARLSTWDEQDLKDWVRTVPKEHSKNKEAIVRPAPDGIKRWIVNLYTETKNCSYVVGYALQRVTVTGAVNRICRRLGHDTNGLRRIHDFRRTFSIAFNDMGANPYIVELLLGHKVRGVTGIYNKSRHIKKKLEVLNMWVNYLNTTVGFNNNVIEFNKEVVWYGNLFSC